MVNNPLRPFFLGGDGIGGVPLDFMKVGRESHLDTTVSLVSQVREYVPWQWTCVRWKFWRKVGSGKSVGGSGKREKGSGNSLGS